MRWALQKKICLIFYNQFSVASNFFFVGRNFDHYSCPYLTVRYKTHLFCAIKLFVVYHVPLDIRYDSVWWIECTAYSQYVTRNPWELAFIRVASNMQWRESFQPNHTLSMTWMYCVCINWWVCFRYDVATVHSGDERVWIRNLSENAVRSYIS